MCRCQITSPAVNLDIEIKPSADFMTCMIPALLAALPAFITALMQCMSGGGTSGVYNPGDRKRCT